MLPDRDPRAVARTFVTRGLMKVFDSQTETGRAALLGFVHLSEDARLVTLRFHILKSGRARLVMEAHPAIAD